jgi:hypothetical protein
MPVIRLRAVIFDRCIALFVDLASSIILHEELYVNMASLTLESGRNPYCVLWRRLRWWMTDIRVVEDGVGEVMEHYYRNPGGAGGFVFAHVVEGGS